MARANYTQVFVISTIFSDFFYEISGIFFATYYLKNVLDACLVLARFCQNVKSLRASQWVVTDRKAKLNARIQRYSTFYFGLL